MAEGERQERTTPPFFRNWRQLYIFVLLFHVAVIVFLYLLTLWFDIHA